MAAAAAGSVLSAVPASRASVRFALATPADDAALRQLLRENPMAGRISISLEREPNYFAASAIEGPEHQTIVAFEDGRLACAGNISARQRFINGHAMRVGYLGGLRLDARFRGRTDIVRRGYRMFRQLHEQGGPPIYLTSIAEDNEPARRLLERGIKGMPTYRYLGDLVTLVISRPRRRTGQFDWGKPNPKLREVIGGTPWPHATAGGAVGLPRVAAFLSRTMSAYQFAPVWTEHNLAARELSATLRSDDFSVVGLTDSIFACAAVWDQRAIKQTVVRGYSPLLRGLRPLVNAAARVLGRPILPRVGSPIAGVYLSHLAGDLNDLSIAWLDRVMNDSDAAAGAEHFVTAFDRRDVRLILFRKWFKPREYVTRLYAVHFDDGAELAASLDDRLLAPEVATL